MFTLINAADCDASTLTALSRGRKARTQRDSIELYAPAIANARPIITPTIVGARSRAMGRYREGPRAQARSYNGRVLVTHQDAGAQRVLSLSCELVLR